MSKIGRVYCIQHKGKLEISYIGSTFETLNERFQRHKSDCKLYEIGTRKYLCAIGEYILEYGFENFDIFLLKEYQVCDKQHLLVLEQLWINTSVCVNKLNACALTSIFKKESRKLNHQQHKERDNKASIEYNKIHKEQIKEWHKKYIEDNKEKISDRRKEYRAVNKEKIKELSAKTFECICGSIIRIGEKSRHNKSAKHKNYIDSNK